MNQTTDRTDDDLTWAALQAAIEEADRETADAQAERDYLQALMAVLRPYMEHDGTMTVEVALELLQRDKARRRAELLARRKRWGL